MGTKSNAPCKPACEFKADYPRLYILQENSGVSNTQVTHVTAFCRTFQSDRATLGATEACAQHLDYVQLWKIFDNFSYAQSANWDKWGGSRTIETKSLREMRVLVSLLFKPRFNPLPRVTNLIVLLLHAHKKVFLKISPLPLVAIAAPVYATQAFADAAPLPLSSRPISYHFSQPDSSQHRA
jgi:hypothetical protein